MRAVCLMLAWLLPALACAEQLAGTVEADVGGRRVEFPVLKTDVTADVQGDLATVSVVQTFANPLAVPVHARYLFPLNRNAAVNAMTMEVGDERIRAEIQEIHAAKKTFEAAKQAGKAAALLEQHRPNMFTQRIANLMPGLPIRVTLVYVQTVPKVDGHYELVVPLVVGPRFQPVGADAPRRASSAVPADTAGEWKLEALPKYPPVRGLDIPDTVDAERVSIAVDLEAGVPVRWAASDTHRVTVDQPAPRLAHVALAGGRTIDNRDFVLQYALAGPQTSAGVLAARDGRGGFFSLLIEPPAAPQQDEILPREVVFVLDCSGSMSGLPMQASKAFMREALANLRGTDSFRIVRFSDSATEFSRQPLPATPDNLRRGAAYTDSLRGSGGTMMTSGIRQALAVPAPAGALRLVVFLTDGYIGNELEALRLVESLRGDARLYAFGVGAGVNRYLLDELGRVGHGFTRYMDPTEAVADVAHELAGRIDAPVLTDIAIDWGNAPVADVTPAQLPDLFAGGSVRVQGRYTQPGDYQIRVHGRARGHAAELRLPVSFPARPTTAENNPIAAIWARSSIADAMHELVTPPQRRPSAEDNDMIQARVTKLGLDYSLVSRWTAFVAVSEQIYNAQPGGTPDRDLPLPLVKGVTANAYPRSGFTGVVAPEPSPWLALAVMALVLLAATRRTFRAGTIS